MSIQRFAVTRLLLGVLLLGGLVGCRADDQRTDTLDPERAMQRREAFPEAGMAQLDSGNVAFGEERHEAALAHYRRATEIMPDNAASWFGIAMAAGALGRPELADSALTEARKHAPGATMIHPVAPVDPDGRGL